MIPNESTFAVAFMVANAWAFTFGALTYRAAAKKTMKENSALTLLLYLAILTGAWVLWWYVVGPWVRVLATAPTGGWAGWRSVGLPLVPVVLVWFAPSLVAVMAGAILKEVRRQH